MILTNKELEDALESVVDTFGLGNVLASLAEICDQKSEHLAVNWQDTTAAKRWSRAAASIRNLSDTPIVEQLS